METNNGPVNDLPTSQSEPNKPLWIRSEASSWSYNQVPWLNPSQRKLTWICSSSTDRLQQLHSMKTRLSFYREHYDDMTHLSGGWIITQIWTSSCLQRRNFRSLTLTHKKKEQKPKFYFIFLSYFFKFGCGNCDKQASIRLSNSELLENVKSLYS